MKFGGLQKITLIDYPNKLAATLFISGCNFRCPFCYSSELVLSELIKEHPEFIKQELLEFLEERKGLLDGIVLCGGEPTIHNDLPELIKEIKDFGYLVKLDTNGSNPKMLKKLIDEKLIDYVAMDIKISKEKYDKLVGLSGALEKVKKSIKILKNSDIGYEFRTTVVPEIHTKQNIIDIANWIGPARAYYLQNFRAEKTIDSKFENIKPYSDEFLKEIQQEIKHLFKICEIR